MRIIWAFLLVIMVSCGGNDACEPSCDSVVCGDDGCGGTCGQCEGNNLCLTGACVECIPNCSGKDCGPDGCGRTCGSCPDYLACDPGSLTCTTPPNPCESSCGEDPLGCGPDGCGESCGECKLPEVCHQASLLCQTPCVPSCEGLICGDDGCGGDCGECEEPSFCDLGVCIQSDILPTEEFTIAFKYKGRITGTNESEQDLLLINPDQTTPMKMGSNEPLSLNEFTLEDAAGCHLIEEVDAAGEPTKTGPCSCEYGCLMHPSRDWLAISTRPPTLDGMTWMLGSLSENLQLEMLPIDPIMDIVDYSFAGDYFYFSKRINCLDDACQYSISRVSLTSPAAPQELLVFPPHDDPDWQEESTYRGHFKASGDGSTLAILSPTIRSLRIYQWSDGMLSELELLCSNWKEGRCVGAGSEFSDNEALGISQDGSLMALVTTSERELRIHLYGEGEPKVQTLFGVPSGSYLTNICPNISTESWKFKTIAKDPVFTKDNKSLLMLTMDDCTVSGSEVKAETDIIMMDLDSIDDDNEFEERDFQNITKNPKDSGVDNQVITDFSLSPAGKVIVFTGTPKYSNGEEMEDGALRSMRDKEIWVVGLSGAGKAQLTDNGAFEALAPTTTSSEGF
jgi:hypothetical protein